MTAPVFAIDSVARSFRGKAVLVSASAWVRPGKCTALVGRNGCGKSTLLRIGTGSLRSARGIVQCGDWRGRRPRWHQLARQGVFMWPDQTLLPRDVLVSELFSWVQHAVASARVDEAVETCEIGDLLPKRTRVLSGGERRRVELGLVMARDPTVLLADEPFLGVMPKDRRFILRVFGQLTKRGGGLLVTGHEVDTLFDLADDVIWMTAGTTHHLGTPEEALRHHQFRREYLGGRSVGLAENDRLG